MEAGPPATSPLLWNIVLKVVQTTGDSTACAQYIRSVQKLDQQKKKIVKRPCGGF